ncbi:DUF302 domain-containing protein [Ectothiorhodospiraceae bacterium 2226]|nr:DUF302 domain-containing protein [Ectothiorhodospiraceae bacterium 2226]
MHKRIIGLLLLLFSVPLLAASPLEDSVVSMPVAEGVSADDAIESMKLRANTLNMALVGELPLSAQLEAMGLETRRMEIFQFCDPVTAQKMVEHDLLFAAYLPCRIALVEDPQGQFWLVMMDLNPLIEMGGLSAELRSEAEQVRDVLQEIMQAGAEGDI